MDLKENSNYTHFGFKQVGQSYRYDLGSGLEFAKYNQESFVRLQTDRVTIPLRGCKTFADLQTIKKFIYPTMTPKTKELLKDAKDYCDTNDKSTEFMIEYMKSVAGVDLDTVIKYLKTTQ